MMQLVLGRHGDLIAERDPRRQSGRLLRQGDMDASYIDLADPSHLEFDYMRWMRIVLRAAGARTVLHIGGGACALARALVAEDRASRHEVCETDAAVLALAREYFGLRSHSGLRVRHAEGRRFVSAHRDARWDAIVLDAFVAATVPRALITVQAMAAFANAAPLTLVNVVDDRGAREVHAIAAALASAYPEVWTLGARVGNTVLVGAVAKLNLDRIAAQAAGDPSPARITVPAALARRISGTLPWRDEDLTDAGPG
jgi:hypothetical protein